MKIGIITVHDSSNFGSVYQALGLQTVLKNAGHEPYFIATRSMHIVRWLFLGYDASKWGRSVYKFMKWFAYQLVHPFKLVSSIKKYRIYKEFWRYYDHIIRVKDIHKFSIDMVLFGSDELWNVRKPAFRNPLLYGVGIPSPHKIAYSISIGDMDMNEWDPYPFIRQSIKQFDAIYVRDNRTLQLFQREGIAVKDLICDPSIQADIRKLMYADSPANAPKQPFLLVYTYDIPPRIRDFVRRFAREMKLITVSVTLYQPWCDRHIECSPLHFGSLLRQAKFVYTSTYHGSILSAMYHTNFVSLPVSPKVHDILTQLGLDNVMIDSCACYEDFKSAMVCQKDYAGMEKKIIEMQIKARDALEHIVSIGKESLNGSFI